MSEFNKFDIVEVIINKRQEEPQLATVLEVDKYFEGEEMALVQYHHNSCSSQEIGVQYMKLHQDVSGVMNETRARELLGDEINEDGLYNTLAYSSWNNTDQRITLDGEFTIEDLEAYAWWMKNHGVKK